QRLHKRVHKRLRDQWLRQWLWAASGLLGRRPWLLTVDFPIPVGIVPGFFCPEHRKPKRGSFRCERAALFFFLCSFVGHNRLARLLPSIGNVPQSHAAVGAARNQATAARRDPKAMNDADASVVTLEVVDLLALLEVPHPDGLILAGRHDAATAGQEQ